MLAFADADPQRHDHGRRQALSPTSSTSASAAPISARRWQRGRSRPSYRSGLNLHFVSNVDGADLGDILKQVTARDDAVHRLLEDIHDARDDDERAIRAQGRCCGARRGGGQGSLLRGVDAARQDRGIRHCRGSRLRVLGLGRRPLFRSGRRSACLSRSALAASISPRSLAGGEAVDKHFVDSSARKKHSRPDGAFRRLVPRRLGVRRTGRDPLRSTARALRRLSAAARNGIERQIRDARRSSRRGCRPRRSFSASPAPMASTPSSNSSTRARRSCRSIFSSRRRRSRPTRTTTICCSPIASRRVRR